jgi:hypothetical protein
MTKNPPRKTNPYLSGNTKKHGVNVARLITHEIRNATRNLI